MVRLELNLVDRPTKIRISLLEGSATIGNLSEGIEVNVAQGSTLMKAAALAGVELEGPCGGKGTCGKENLNGKSTCRNQFCCAKKAHYS